MKQFFLLILNVCFLTSNAQEVGIGYWRDYLPYQRAINICISDNQVYVATTHGLFTYGTETNSVTRLNKLNYLSDIELSVMKKDPLSDLIILAYSNGNIDILKGQAIYNLPDLKRENIIGDKNINDVYFKDNIAYLSCSFGIIELDPLIPEIKNTYHLNNSNNLSVNDLSSSNDSLFAVTDSGVYKAGLSDNLSDFRSWHKISSPSSVTMIEKSSQGLFFGTSSDSLFYSTNWQFITTLEGLKGLKQLEEKTMAFTANSVYELSEEEATHYSGSSLAKNITDLALTADDLWLAERGYSLIRVSSDGEEYILPQGPKSENVFHLSHSDNKLFVSPGGITTTWGNNNTWEGFYWSDGTYWRSIPYGLLNNTKDITTILNNPQRKEELFVGSWNAGVLKLTWNEVESEYQLVTIYNHLNTSGALEPISSDTSSNVYGWLRIKGMAFDKSGHLWMANSQANRALVVKSPADEWSAFKINSYNTLETHLGDLVIDNYNQKWIVIPKGGGLIVYSDNNTLNNSNDDQDITLTSSPGNGNLPSNDIYSIAKDRDGEIWVGTNKGVGVFYAPENVFSGNNFDAQQILVEVDGYVEQLLTNETVTAIAIDGANRKWLGTQSAGVYLFSADGSEQVHHFTAENSPLFSNNIMDIAINEQSGEVYIGTSKGLLSYKSEATSGGESHQNVMVYPNPVRENYRGKIAIKGLVQDAKVRITDLTGNLVTATTALGGQAVWDGTNGDGNRVQTGVYLVFSTNTYGSETNVAKILLIH